MENKGITQFLTKHAGLDPVSFHMPGHKGSGIYEKYGYGHFLDNIMGCDITEIQGADNLFQTEGIIKETAEKYKELYDSNESYLLINGTSGGLIASILAAVPEGGKLIMARNCHKSVFNALTLGHIEPVYAYPEIVEEYGISGVVESKEIERLIEANPDAEAVILPSPNYYGICSDIKAIAQVVHHAGKVLIVDQAHGAHLKFFGKMPLSAEECGADIAVNSTHKTLLSFTQSAVLNLNSDRVDKYLLEDKLQAMESTSPSYILMASLDINADILLSHGKELFDRWQENLNMFYAEASRIEGLTLMELPGHMDKTKINIDMSAYGLRGSLLEELLLRENIFSELVTGNILMCMTGIGNTDEDFRRLLSALKSIAEQRQLTGIAAEASHGAHLWSKRRPLKKAPKIKKLVSLEDCAGKICAASIIPYPPGIPFICPGEEIGEEEIQYIKELRLRGEKVIGVSEDGMISVG
ncbi:MAG: aminotransferase class V-fold PLP-dependent enzyme [Clostridiales bacterium]|nr:aminotransferase class V-fold PLP-dependent enzyme [Clostridiales bacterium]